MIFFPNRAFTFFSCCVLLCLRINLDAISQFIIIWPEVQLLDIHINWGQLNKQLSSWNILDWNILYYYGCKYSSVGDVLGLYGCFLVWRLPASLSYIIKARSLITICVQSSNTYSCMTGCFYIHGNCCIFTLDTPSSLPPTFFPILWKHALREYLFI